MSHWIMIGILNIVLFLVPMVLLGVVGWRFFQPISETRYHKVSRKTGHRERYVWIALLLLVVLFYVDRPYFHLIADPKDLSLFWRFFPMVVAHFLSGGIAFWCCEYVKFLREPSGQDPGES